MREAFAHEAFLRMEAEADTRAPGAAITVALCGHWEHSPPCPLAPHRSSARRVAGTLHVRTLFAVEPSLEGAVRERIESALATGSLEGHEAPPARWTLLISRASVVIAEEADHAQRLIGS